MKLPWWHHPGLEPTGAELGPYDDNPNGFYPEPPPEPPQSDVDFCHCHGCGERQWTFCAEDAWQWISGHVTHTGNITVTPAGDVYRQLVDAILHDAARTIGPRT